MELLASIGLAMAVLGLSLIIQSRILRDSPDRWPVLARRLRILAFTVSIPIGIILVVIGFLLPAFADSYISVGAILIIVAITLVVQSQALTSDNNSLSQLSRKTKIWAYICTGVGVIAVLIALIRVLLQG